MSAAIRVAKQFDGRTGMCRTLLGTIGKVGWLVPADPLSGVSPGTEEVRARTRLMRISWQ
jgi:hypothetical protein